MGKNIQWVLIDAIQQHGGFPLQITTYSGSETDWMSATQSLLRSNEVHMRIFWFLFVPLAKETLADWGSICTT